MRLKKERDRKERLQNEEKSRIDVDERERQYQQQVREDAIKKANMMLYSQDDPVKTFSSKLFLSHVLDERSKQVVLERNRKEKQKQQDCEWAIIQDRAIRQLKVEEDAKIQKQRLEASKLRVAQQEQLQEVRNRKLREREEARIEGQQIREAAERSIMKEREAEDYRRAKAIEVNKQYLEDNKRHRELRNRKQQEELEELQKIQLFAQLKEEQMQERKRRAENKFEQQLSARQAMIDRQAKHLEMVAGEAEERVLTQIRDAENERLQRVATQKAKRDKFWSEIDTSRQKQLHRKEEDKERQGLHKKRIQEVQRQRQAALMEEELVDRRESRKKAEKLQAFQILQITEKEEKKRLAREQEVEEGILMTKSIEKEEQMFQAYVDSVMVPIASRRKQQQQPQHIPQPPPPIS